MGGVEYGAGRQALLEAAIKLVARQGLRGLTYRSVAAEASVTHGSVRYHFGDWHTLVEEALSFSVQRSIESAELASDAPGFEGFAGALAVVVAANSDDQAFQYELAMEARRRPELRPTMERAYETYRAAVRDALRKGGVDDDALSDVVFAALDGLVFQQTTFGDSQHTHLALKSLRHLIAAYAKTET